MNLAADESKAILFKSISLIEKTIDRLERVDELQFPTLSSTHARQLLLKALNAVRSPENLEPMAPAVLYKNLFPLQEVAEVVIRSSTDHISWPLVSYCDDIWNRIFKTNGPSLFYSLTTVHNYRVFSFSNLVHKHLNGVLAEPQTKKLIDGRELYCLELPSSEDANLPLYANIGHEFGHAVFNHRSSEILKILEEKTQPLRTAVLEELKRQDAGLVERRFRHVPTVLKKLGAELFCDIVGARLMGPAFLLSLFEMSWGQDDKFAWIVKLSSDENLTSAYPSFPFRLGLIKRWLDVGSFCSEAEREFAELNMASRKSAGVLNDLPVDDQTDTVHVRPNSDENANAVRKALTMHLADLKRALTEFAAECDTLVKRWWPDDAPMADAATVAKLLRRLEHHILPNIVPQDDSLLGTRAPFPAILIASALHRLQLLTRGDVDIDKATEMSRQIGIVERLTAKALEVTYVQCKYSQWSGDVADERTQ
jgi:hypothetical protein